MKLDHYKLIVRENGDTGDSMAETWRARVLGFIPTYWLYNIWRTEKGYKRHPDSPWPESDMSNDQILPMLLGEWYAPPSDFKKAWFFIPGTRTFMQPAVYAIKWRSLRLLQFINWVQGLLLALPFRWSDDDSEGHGFRSSKNKVQDYLNMIVIWHFLNKQGVKAKLPRPARECYWAVWRYYARGNDPEPNSKWVRRLYFNALKAGLRSPARGR